MATKPTGWSRLTKAATDDLPHAQAQTLADALGEVLEALEEAQDAVVRWADSDPGEDRRDARDDATSATDALTYELRVFLGQTVPPEVTT